MSSSSQSEGEIVESDIEKATTALPSAKDTSVNRKLRDALSPSPVPLSPSPSATVRSRDRSRSPYRAERDRSPRGEKRRRTFENSIESSRTDPRRFKVHYEGGPDIRGERRRRGPYDGVDREASSTSYVRYGDRDERDRYKGKRPRTRSRSPGRLGRADELSGRYGKDNRGGNGTGDGRNRYVVDGGKMHGSRDQSVSERGAAPFSAAQRTRREAETGTTLSQQRSDTTNGDNPTKRSDDQSILNEKTVPNVQLGSSNEVLSIEERRKRREAIKAKYKTQNTPLLVQALQLGTVPGSPTSTVGSGDARFSRSVSPVANSPQTPQHDSTQDSPPFITISDDAELANTSAVAEQGPNDEPSAADYDPTMDMQEERARHTQRQDRENVSASAYDERVVDEKKQVLLPQSDVEYLETSAKSLKPADDMFASDEEDDMFAPIVTSKPSRSDAEPNRAVTVPKAKELDMSLLDNWDDHEAYYRIILGELLDGRYHVQANLGKGMFSSVVRAIDNHTSQLVAIKIIRNNETMIKAGTKEMEILQKLADADPEDKKHMIRLERSFPHKGHLCMVFENLSINLREVLKKFGRDVGINLKAVRSYAQQMFLGLSLLRKCNILHADLKPDNILVNEARNMLKICDLGSAADASDNEITPYLVSRFYRAPEVILGIPYDFAIDMWSIGCTLFELYTGKILFTGRTNNQMLRSIMECRGKFSLKMLKKAEFGAVHFDDNNLNFRSVERDKITGRDVTRLINFVKPTRDLKSRLLAGTGAGATKKMVPDAELKEINLFVDLLDRCLALNPEKRITPSEALKHPFIHRGVVGMGKI